MSRVGIHLAAIESWLTALQHEGAPLVTECRRQLDLVDPEDVERQSFRTPAAFLVLPRYRFVVRPDGGRDVACEFAIVIAGRGTAGRPIDEDLIDRSITLAEALDDQDFGQRQCSAASDVEARPVLQAGLETKGLALVAVSFRQVLFAVRPAHDAVMGVIGQTGAGAPSEGSPVELNIGLGPELTPDEQQIVEGWRS